MKWLKKIESYFYDEDESPIIMYMTLAVFAMVLGCCGTLQVKLWMM